MLATISVLLVMLAACSGSSAGDGDLNLVHQGQLTFATSAPFDTPWFADGQPTNGRGFESALAYAIAAKLGFSADRVRWTTVSHNDAIAAGKKSFDIDIDHVAISPQLRENVDLSVGYYTIPQTVVALRTSRIAQVTTLAALRDAKLGVRATGNGQETIAKLIAPVQEPAVFADTNEAAEALENGPIDGIVVDFVTAFALTHTLPNAFILGQFFGAEPADQLGMVFERGNPLAQSVDDALSRLRGSGDLLRIAGQWLGAEAGAPALQ
ncbi:ABC transporter substrate-binding protein [Frankia sp. R82]|uniref:substrate-binding periplasmic protein n=1 Tax=Frankia sp. R82 TaxID=2950553 RepID=UPI002043C2B3|nr:transporter substrate-binding domain-containing protein [Frankia sp. R82]MCM3883297.1 transporter substrate-binding domain-containing protein [Frankia sp. R82]